MFYPTDNSLKKGGKFYLIWMADSWPTQFAQLTQRQVMSADIVHICDELLEVINKESLNPLRNFSLRLSSMLLHGMIRLFERKATLILNEMCMMNASVLKHIKERHEPPKKKIKRQHQPRDVPVLQHAVPELTTEEQQQLNNMMEFNVVARIEDITLRDEVVPAPAVTYDGFGEENPMELFVNTSEVMRHMSSGMETNITVQGPYNLSVGSKDVTRVPTITQSMMEDTLIEERMDGAKDVTPFPQIRNDLQEQLNKTPEPIIVASTPLEAKRVLPDRKAKKSPPPEDIELVIEDVQPVVRRRRRRRGLIVDKQTMLTADFIKSRLMNNVELRCEHPEDEIANLLLPPIAYFVRPASCGRGVPINLAKGILKMFRRMLFTRPQRNSDDLLEQILHAKPIQEPTTHHQPEQMIAKPLDATGNQTEIIPDETAIQRDLSAVVQRAEMERTVEVEQPVDISDLPTQILPRSQPVEQVGAKRKRDSEQLPPRKCSKVVMASTIQSATRDQVPFAEDVRVREPTLLDFVDNEIGIPPVQQVVEEAPILSPRKLERILQHVSQEKKPEKSSSDSETPLGSLDRTQVSLGDAPSVTESQAALRADFSSGSVMLKIALLTKRKKYPVTLDKVLKLNYKERKKAICAALCFYSLLKLKSAGYVDLIKKPNSIELGEIKLGQRCFY